MFERMDMDGAVPPFEQAFLPSNIVKGFLRNWTIQIFARQIKIILSTWTNDSNIFPNIQVMIVPTHPDFQDSS